LNVDHIAAIVVGGIVASTLILTGHAEAGAAIGGAVVGYAFKNGSEVTTSAK